MTLDIRTLSSMTVLFGFFYGFGLLLVRRTYPAIGSFSWLSLAMFCAGGGFLLIALRAQVNDLLSIVVANTLVYLTFLFAHIAFARLLGWRRLPGLRVLLALALVLPMGMAYWTFVAPNLNFRIVLVSGAIALAALMTASLLVKASSRLEGALRMPCNMASLSFFALAAILVVRAVWVLGEPLLGDFMAVGSVHAAAFIVYIMWMITSSFGFIWIASTMINLELKRQATRDSLTGLFNRRAFDEMAARDLARARRSSLPVAFVIADIDHFKRINDTYGHLAGDEMLRHVAQRLQEGIRSEDVVARFGGEEFALILPEAGVDTAVTTAERLRTLIAGQSCRVGSNELTCTLSFGVAVTNGEPTDDVLSRADKALYAAKKGGRNRVCIG